MCFILNHHLLPKTGTIVEWKLQLSSLVGKTCFHNITLNLDMPLLNLSTVYSV